MRALKVFLFGLLYGWFIKIAFDRIYRENDLDDVRNENRSLKEYIHSLEGQLASRSSQGEPARFSAEPKAYPTEPGPAPTLISPPAPRPIDLPEAIPTVEAPAEPFDVPAEMPAPASPPSLGASEGDRDDLKIIKGIGPAIERKLNNAGIYTFAALSQLSPKQLEDILGSQVRRLQDENDLISQAIRLVQNTPTDQDGTPIP